MIVSVVQRSLDDGQTLGVVVITVRRSTSSPVILRATVMGAKRCQLSSYDKAKSKQYETLIYGL